MAKENRLTIKKETLITRISKFFKNLFTPEIEAPEQEKSIKDLEKDNLNKILRVEEVQEIQRLLQLQEMIRNRQIEEKNISKEDQILLRRLYHEQILNLEKSIKGYKRSIMKIKSSNRVGIE